MYRSNVQPAANIQIVSDASYLPITEYISGDTLRAISIKHLQFLLENVVVLSFLSYPSLNRNAHSRSFKW